MAFLAVTVQADQLSNTFKMGNGTQSNKRIILNRGGSNPEIRWNETTDKLQFSNDGSAFENIGTLQSEPNLLENIGASFSQGSGNLTMNLKQADGSTDPATDGPLRVAMRSSTITSGAYNVRSRTTAASLLIDNGATMGFTSGATEFLYWYLLDNSGTLEIAVSKSLFPESELASTTAMSNAADSGSVMYSTTGRSNVPIRLFMRTKHSLTTAGSWDEVPDSVYPAPQQIQFSEVLFLGSTGHGSTNTKIRRFTSVTTKGRAATATQSSTNGDSILIVEDGIYSIYYLDKNASGSEQVGISLNSSELTTSFFSITSSAQIVGCQAAAGLNCVASATLRLSAGDVLRAHTTGSADSVDTRLRLTKIAD